MEHQLRRIFKWVYAKHSVDNLALFMHPDYSGSIVNSMCVNNVLFCFADIMEVTKEDVDNFDYYKWLEG